MSPHAVDNKGAPDPASETKVKVKAAQHRKDADKHTAASSASVVLSMLYRCLVFLLSPCISFLERLLLIMLSAGPVPQHIAIIMDGNRRYARNYPGGPIPVSQGHLSGFNALRSVLEVCLKLRGMTTVSVYAFAINNFSREQHEVDALMELAKRNLVQLAAHGEVLARHSVRLRMIGRKNLLPLDVQRSLENVERMTSGNMRATLNVCIAYSSSDEIAYAMQRCLAKRAAAAAAASSSANGEMRDHDDDDIRVDELEADMMLADSPPVDILIRTSDVHRFSDFMLWQTTDAQLQFTKRYWPLFGLRELVPIMLDYQRMIIRRWLEERLFAAA